MKKILILSAFGLFGALATVNAQSAAPSKVAATPAAETEQVATEKAVEAAAASEMKEAPAKKKSCCASKASASKKSGCGSADKAHAHATDAKTGKSCCASKGKAEARLTEEAEEDADSPSVQ